MSTKTILTSIAIATILGTTTANANEINYACDFGYIRMHHRIILNTETNKAKVIGFNGHEAEVIPVFRTDGNAVTFIEVTDSGNVMTTTILEDGRAVTSRNYVSFYVGKISFIPSQIKGECIISWLYKN